MCKRGYRRKHEPSMVPGAPHSVQPVLMQTTISASRPNHERPLVIGSGDAWITSTRMRMTFPLHPDQASDSELRGW